MEAAQDKGSSVTLLICSQSATGVLLVKMEPQTLEKVTGEASLS